MFSKENSINNQDADDFIHIITPFEETLPNAFEFQAEPSPDATSVESVISNEDELERALEKSIELAQENNHLKLRLETQEKLSEHKDTKILSMQIKLDKTNEKWQAEVDKITKERDALLIYKQKQENAQDTIEILKQKMMVLEQELKTASEREARETAGKLEAQHALAINNSMNQTSILQYKAQYEEVLTNLRNEQASHQADNVYWQNENVALRKRIPVYSSIFAPNK